MAKGKKGRAGKAARYKAAANDRGPSARHTNQDIASLYLPKAAAAHSQSEYVLIIWILFTNSLHRLLSR